MERSGVGLCLSGGGYRAMLFHTGALWRLNELGWLPRLDVVSGVSGGALAAGVLAKSWHELDFGKDGVATNFVHTVVRPVRDIAQRNLDIAVGLRGILKPWRSAGEELTGSYRRQLFGDFALADLPESPRFVFTAANLQTGGLWRFAKDSMADQVVGGMANPDISLATAVAASSAFPPLLSPILLPVHRWDIDGNGTAEQPRKIVLTDGGIYDNLSVFPIADYCRTVLVSDGGLRMPQKRRIPRNWPQHMVRVLDVVDNQVRSLRVGELIDSYVDGEIDGAYWGSYSKIRNFELPDALPAPVEQTLALAELPSRMSGTPKLTQQRLINWGYAICDAGMRRWVEREAPRPDGFPYPSIGVG